MIFGAFMGQERAGHKVADRLELGVPDLAAIWRSEARRAILWLPVAMGAGVWLYFWLDREPSPLWCALILLPVWALLGGRTHRAGFAAVAVALALTAFGAGFGFASWAAHRAHAPILAAPIEETVEGRVLGLSKSASGAPRALLDRVVVYGMDPVETPARVRVTLLATDRESAPGPGQRIRIFARLLPPGEPVEPGAFDFGLRAYFDRLGAVGYARGVALIVEARPPRGLAERAQIWIARRRAALSDALLTALPGRQGAFAAAIIAGDRSGIDEVDAEALRVSNLAHLLAISGLHMGLLTGLVFAAARLVFVALGLSGAKAKKTAAVIALLAGFGYLLISGATVATQRAFVMMAVAFTAVLLDRPAITLRGLALAAMVVLAVRPVSLMDVGFQMSFAATAALVAGWEEVRRRRQARDRDEKSRAPEGRWQKLRRRSMFYLAGIVFTSIIAGAATAPFAAYHFNRIAPYGLPANLAAVPVMGLVIAPSAVAAGLAAPFGLADLPLRVMGAGIEWVLAAAHSIAALPGAIRPVAVAPALVLPLIALGGLWLFLWRGPGRLAGAAAIAAALILWAGAPTRPEVLIAPEARLIGVMGAEGRVLDHPRAQSFAAKSWLRRDGDSASQKDAYTRPGLTRGKGWFSATLINGWRLEAVHSRRIAPSRVVALCQPRTLVILRYGPRHQGPCIYLGKDDLARLGAVAVRAGGAGLRVIPANDPRRRRLWSRGQ